MIDRPDQLLGDRAALAVELPAGKDRRPAWNRSCRGRPGGDRSRVPGRGGPAGSSAMALRPSTNSCQNSSRLSAPGNRQAMPMIARGMLVVVGCVAMWSLLRGCRVSRDVRCARMQPFRAARAVSCSRTRTICCRAAAGPSMTTRPRIDRLARRSPAADQRGKSVGIEVARGGASSAGPGLGADQLPAAEQQVPLAAAGAGDVHRNGRRRRPVVAGRLRTPCPAARRRS